MKLKKAILEQLGRDELKAICQTLELTDVDMRSVESMGAKVSRAHRADPEFLFQYLSEGQVKAVAERMGYSSVGRKGDLVERILNSAFSQAERAAEIQLTGDAGETGRRVKRRGGRSGKGRKRRSEAVTDQTEQYRHEAEAVQRPDVGIQDQFQAKKPPKTYRYDSSLDPELSWDEQRERDLGEWLLGLIERAAKEVDKAVFAEAQAWKGGGVRVTSTQDAVRLLKDISKPFLNWAGKAERHQINVPTVPLFVHERHSTKAILDGIRHRKARGSTLDLFGDPAMDIRDQLEAYEHKGPWQNRMILGDSLSVMSSLLEFEGLGGQMQMIYVDPPYGVKFGSNFQPFVRKKEVKHGRDDEMTREPEMVKAYRDTWELGLHSYLTYLRDRLVVARELLRDTGSVFVQISDENVHHVREVMDEIFGADNFCAIINFRKTSGASSPQAKTNVVGTVSDYIVWYARDMSRVHYRRLYAPRPWESNSPYRHVDENGVRRRMTADEVSGRVPLSSDSRVYRLDQLSNQSIIPSCIYPIELDGREFMPPAGRHWATTLTGMRRLMEQKRVELSGNTPSYVRFQSDFSYSPMSTWWDDTGMGGFVDERLYVVQTNAKVIGRCLLMTTDPGDLVLDPTCGSGTTAYVAEQWGRRWITIDTSRVPLALARQRLLTATFPYYELKDPGRGPAGGFVYRRKQNKKGEEIGGLVPHITLKSIANDEQPAMEVLVDRPEEMCKVTRVTGPFVVEATVAPVQPLEQGGDGEHTSGDTATHIERMTEVLRQSKTLQLPGNRELTLAGIRRTADTEYLHAEAKEGDKRIAIVFGPQDGAISSIAVYEAAREAHYLKYDLLYFFGFAIQAKAREMIEDESGKLRIPATYVAVTPDVAMSDLLKTTRGSEIFSITGLPDFEVRRAKKKGPEGRALYQVELKGLDIFDPESLETESVEGESVPCWMLDTDYDGMSFYASQVFFPKTSAWDNLQKSLKATFEEEIWEHLAGTTSEPFVLGEKKRVAVKVIDERGNELLRVRDVEV